MASPKKAPVLSLSTVIERSTVAIDGTAYEMRSPDEMAWLVYRGNVNLFQRAGALMKMPRRTALQEKQLEALLKPLVEAILLAPKPVLAKLNTDQRWAVIMVFSALLPTVTPTVGANPTKATAVKAATAH